VKELAGVFLGMVAFFVGGCSLLLTTKKDAMLDGFLPIAGGLVIAFLAGRASYKLTAKKPTPPKATKESHDDGEN
jgi:hypothetical protein